jgi:translation initiation factor 3 subunit C
VYRNGDERTKARTMLCHIYHESQKGNFFRARDMLLMSHLQDSIHLSDISTQILFNRAMVQLGLCAFYSGLVNEAHSCLSEVLAGSRVKELLAQGITSSRYADRNPEQEKEERRRQIPYHMHINLDLLECVHLVCAMLLEVPNMAETPLDLSKRKLMSKPFRRVLQQMENQVFMGPPENTREFVMVASKALMRGDWRKCRDLIMSIKVWALVPNKDEVLSLLHTKIQEEGLRTYLFTYSPYYDSLSLDELCSMFELERNVVHSIVSKMMINEELHASWDQPTNDIVMNQVEPTRLQSLALQFADKAATFVENNEKLLDFRTGGYGFKYDNKDKRSDRWEDRQQWDGNRGYRRPGGGYRGNRDREYGQGQYHQNDGYRR